MTGFDPHGTVNPHEKIYSDMLSDHMRASKYMIINPGYAPPHILRHSSTVPALPTASQGQIDSIYLPDAIGCKYLEMFQSTAQTLFPTPVADKGYEIALDQVDNETVEYIIGGNISNNPLSFLNGTDQGMFLRATFEIPDADGMDQFGIFIRKQEDYQVPTSFLTTGDPVYTDIALFGFAAAVADPNPLSVSYDLANAGSCIVSSSGFTVADGDIVTLEIRVGSGGVLTFYINGVKLGGTVSKNALGTAITAQNTNPASVTLTAALRYVFGIFSRQDANLSPAYLRRLVCGTLGEEGLLSGGARA